MIQIFSHSNKLCVNGHWNAPHKVVIFYMDQKSKMTIQGMI